MASGEESTAIADSVFLGEEDLVEEVDLEEDDEGRSDSTSDRHRLRHVSSPTVTVAITTAADDADLKQADASVKKSAADESRKLFQRLWTDEDEIELLRGFLEYTASRCGPHDTTAFYDQIRAKFQLDFNKNQLVEKLRRLKKKYRNVVNKFGSGKDHAFKTPHDQATFEIAAKIWGNLNPTRPIPNSAPPNNAGHGSDDDANIISNPNFNGDCLSPNFNGADHLSSSKLLRPKKRNHAGTVKFEEKQQQPFFAAFASTNNHNSDSIFNNGSQQTPTATPVSSMIEETVKSCLAPVLKELLSSSSGANSNWPCFGQDLNLMMPFGFLGRDWAAKDERWKKQQILELEVLSKRLELVQDGIKEQLNELRHPK